MEIRKLAANYATGSLNNSSFNGAALNSAALSSGPLDRAAEDSFERRLKAAMDANDDRALKKVCHEFEAILMNMMYKQMKATVPKSGLISESTARSMFEPMLDEKMMEEAAKTGIGLGDVMYRQLSGRMGAAYKPSAEGE